MGHGTRQMCRICVWDFGLACLDGPHRLEKFCLSKRPSKTAKQGLVWERGSVSLLRLRKPHTGPHRRDSGVIWLCRQLIFRGSSFSVPIPKVLFFVYAAQFLHRTILPSGALITFYRTLLEHQESLFCFLRCDRMCFPQAASKLPQIAVDLVSGIAFSYPDRESLTQVHAAGHAGRS